MHCFTIYYQNKRPKTHKTFERKREESKGLSLPLYIKASHYYQDTKTPIGNFFFLFKIRDLNMIYVLIIWLDSFYFGYLSRENIWCAM